jgi:uncharacterized protein with LGFP repeats
LPTTDARQLSGGAGTVQEFQNGVLYALSSGSSMVVRGAVLARYRAEGAEAGGLGLPTGEETTEGTAQVQRFERGLIHWTAAGGLQTVRGAIAATWLADGGPTGPLGGPLSGEQPAGAGVVQRFQNGSIYWSVATWSQVVRSEFAAAYEAAGGAAGALGLPVAADTASGPGRVQAFQRGSVYWTVAGGAHPVWGSVATAWLADGGMTGPLGAPMSGEQQAGAGVVQRFQNGSIYWSAGTGAQVVRNDFAAAYAAAGGASGPLGLPVAADAASGPGRVQKFQRWALYWTAADGAHPVWGSIATAWLAGGGMSGPLGAPVATEAPAGAGVVQRFQNGSIYWSAATGAQVVRNDFAAAYAAAGGASGPLGLPVGADTASGPGRVQKFQRWALYWTAVDGAHPVWGSIATAWLAGGGMSGPLGPPTSGEVAAGPGSAQTFRNGVLHWSASSGVHRMTTEVLGAYLAGGASAGPLGDPVSDVYVVVGGQRVDFAHGSIVVRNGVAEVVLG